MLIQCITFQSNSPHVCTIFLLFQSYDNLMSVAREADEEVEEEEEKDEPGELSLSTLYSLMDFSFWFETITWDGPFYIWRGHRL